MQPSREERAAAGDLSADRHRPPRRGARLLLERLGMEVTFEVDWVVFVSRPIAATAGPACASWRPGSSIRCPQHREPYRGNSLILTFQVEDARRELEALRAKGIEPDVDIAGRALGPAALHDARSRRRLGRHRPADRARSRVLRRRRARPARRDRRIRLGRPSRNQRSRRVPLVRCRSICPNPSWSAIRRRSSASASMPSSA